MLGRGKDRVPNIGENTSEGGTVGFRLSSYKTAASEARPLTDDSEIFLLQLFPQCRNIRRVSKDIFSAECSNFVLLPRMSIVRPNGRVKHQRKGEKLGVIGIYRRYYLFCFEHLWRFADVMNIHIILLLVYPLVTRGNRETPFLGNGLFRFLMKRYC